MIVADYVAASDEPEVLALIDLLNRHEDAISGDRETTPEAARACLADDVARVATHGGALIVARDGGRVLGFLAMVFEAGQAYLRPAHRPLAWLAELVVAPEARRRGVARALIAEAEARAKAAGARRMMIGAVVGNDGAIATYETLGYRPSMVELAKDL